MNNIEAQEAYRRSNARELVEQVMDATDDAESYDQEAIIDALLEADPYEREFADFRSSDFWEIARRYHTGILTGDTVQIGKGQIRWTVEATYTDAYLLESAAKQRRTIPRGSKVAKAMRTVRRHGRPDLTD